MSAESLRNRKESNVLIQNGFNNVLKCSMGSSERLSHKLLKFWIANYCWEHNLEFATEVTFHSGGRADVVVKDFFLALEVLGSESITKFLAKEYPIRMLPVKVETGHEELLAMLADLHSMDGANFDYYRRQTGGYSCSLK